MRWKFDLIRDIKFGNAQLDDQDPPIVVRSSAGDLAIIDAVKYGAANIELTDFSKDNQRALQQAINQVTVNGKMPKTFLEIGVHRSDNESDNESSTKILLRNVPENGVYLGVDIEDKSYLNDPERGIFTYRQDSSNYDAVKQKLATLGVTELDFIFIDGYHSVNQVLLDWEYVNLLSPWGVVAFHDVNYHPGPARFMRNLDRSSWVVYDSLCPDDYGFGYCYRRINNNFELYSRMINLENQLSELRKVNEKLINEFSNLKK